MRDRLSATLNYSLSNAFLNPLIPASLNYTGVSLASCERQYFNETVKFQILNECNLSFYYTSMNNVRLETIKVTQIIHLWSGIRRFHWSPRNKRLLVSLISYFLVAPAFVKQSNLSSHWCLLVCLFACLKTEIFNFTC